MEKWFAWEGKLKKSKPNFKIKFSEIGGKFHEKLLSSWKCSLLHLKKYMYI